MHARSFVSNKCNVLELVTDYCCAIVSSPFAWCEDVMDRLTLLRGKGMPALFSWSCKR